MLVSLAGAETYAYIMNSFSNNVSIIDAVVNSVTVDVGSFPGGVAVYPAETKVYVTGFVGNNLSVIDTANNTVTECECRKLAGCFWTVYTRAIRRINTSCFQLQQQRDRWEYPPLSVQLNDSSVSATE
jgi:YVTN family beta-propeller protein